MSTFLNYPVATISAALSYLLLGCLMLPSAGDKVRSYFSHPIPATQQYLLAFDTLRGFAALLVAVGHLWYFAYPITAPIQLDYPWIGYAAKAVPMFAMLSGFLIYRSVRNADTAAKVSDYLYRRFFRIYPLYLVSVVGMLVAGQTHTANGEYGGLNYFVADLFMFRVLDAPYFTNPATWSLYVEVLFYAFIPLFIILVPRQRIILVTAAIAGALIVADQVESREFYVWKYFLFGVLASELALRINVTRRLGASLFALGVIWLCLDIQGPRYDVFVKLSLVAHNNSEYTLGLGVAFMLVMFGIGYTGPIARFLNIFPLRFVGIISYSLFLLHPFYLLANFPALKFFEPVPTELWKTYPVMPSWYFAFIYVPGVLIWAAAGFLLVERPGLEFGNAWVRRRRASRGENIAQAPAE